MIQNKPQKIELMLFFVALAIGITGLYFLGSSITGFVIKERSYSEDLNLVVTSSGNYTWQPQNIGELKSIKLDGRVTSYGKAKVYIESNGIKYLVFDSSRLNESQQTLSNATNPITGFAVKNSNQNSSNQNSASDKQKKKNNHAPEWTGDYEFTINGTTKINLSQYYSDKDDDLLTYFVDPVDGLSISVDNDLVTINPATGSDFNATSTITASDGIHTTSTVVKLIVTAQKQVNRAPVWNSNTDTFVIDGVIIVNVSQYFIDEDNDSLTYSSGLVDGITINIDNDLFTLTPAENYSGNSSILFTAFDGKDIASKLVTLVVLKNADNITENVSNILNGTNQTINITKTIAINLSYNSGTVYDANDNGEESVNGVVDLSVAGTMFNWNVNQANLCTKLEIYNVEETSSTTLCNGNADCCAFIGLVPTRSNWSEIYYSTFGKDGAGYNNVVSAQVIYYDVNLSLNNPKSEIYYSDWDNKSVKFFEEEIEFFDKCADSCVLSGLNKSSYTLIFEIEDSAVLRIDKIKYDVLTDVQNNAPVLLKNITKLNVGKNNNLTINLSQYFSDPDGDALAYSYYKTDNITIMFDGNIATIIPDKDVEGARYSYIVANDSEFAVASDIFIINISQISNAQESLIIQNSSGSTLATMDSSGNMRISGFMTQNTTPTVDTNDFIVQDPNGELNLVITNPEGNLLVKELLIQNQSYLSPTPNSFIIQNKTGTTVAYVNSTGSLFLVGNLTQNFTFG